MREFALDVAKWSPFAEVASSLMMVSKTLLVRFRRSRSMRKSCKISTPGPLLRAWYHSSGRRRTTSELVEETDKTS